MTSLLWHMTFFRKCNIFKSFRLYWPNHVIYLITILVWVYFQKQFRFNLIGFNQVTYSVVNFVRFLYMSLFPETCAVCLSVQSYILSLNLISLSFTLYKYTHILSQSNFFLINQRLHLMFYCKIYKFYVFCTRQTKTKHN